MSNPNLHPIPTAPDEGAPNQALAEMTPVPPNGREFSHFEKEVNKIFEGRGDDVYAHGYEETGGVTQTLELTNGRRKSPLAITRLIDASGALSTVLIEGYEEPSRGHSGFETDEDGKLYRYEHDYERGARDRKDKVRAIRQALLVRRLHSMDVVPKESTTGHSTSPDK